MERIKIFKKMHHLGIIAILQPFADSGNMIILKNQLAMENTITNCNGKIFLFQYGDVNCVVSDHDEQKITCDIINNEIQKQFTMTFVYVKCKEYLRIPLWDKMLQQAEIEDKPWC